MKSCFSQVESRMSSSLRTWLLACGAGAALTLAGASHAASVTGVNTFTTADGHASVVFNFDFGTSLQLASFGATLSYDPAVLSLDPVNPAASIGADDLPDGFLENNVNQTPGSLFALFFADPAPLGVASQVTVTFNFLSTLAPGETSKVTLDFDYSDLADLDHPVTLPTATATVSSAVPEPESLALLLAGAGIVAAWGRRRAAGAVHA
jgi:hypothetical protein